MNAERKYWTDELHKMTMPVFENLANGTLHNNLPCRFYGKSDRTPYCMLEAFGRSFCGFAPFAADFPRDGEEALLAEKDRELLIRCLDNATAPSSPDFMNFTGGSQPLVDAAFMAHGLLRSGSFALSLPDKLKIQIITALESSRIINPPATNWLLFSSMVEAGIRRLGGKCDELRVLYGLRQFAQWYKGDGMYGDGSDFHMDYYNSFVIQPMLLDVAREFADILPEAKNAVAAIERNAARYAVILERLISPDGAYPYFGRSICYRYGAFQMLSQAMLERLEGAPEPAAVRCALTAVIRRINNSGIYDKDGWLLHGIYGEQPALAEDYICTGSLYLASAVFLPLGLPESDPFWAAPELPWTSLAVTNGENVMRDRAI